MNTACSVSGSSSNLDEHVNNVWDTKYNILPQLNYNEVLYKLQLCNAPVTVAQYVSETNRLAHDNTITSSASLPFTPSDRVCGLSCHHCKSKKSIDALTFCSNVHHSSVKDRQCQKKYCTSCLNKWYSGVPTVLDSQWTCYACMNRCKCKRCSKSSPRTPNTRSITRSVYNPPSRVKRPRTTYQYSTASNAQALTVINTHPGGSIMPRNDTLCDISSDYNDSCNDSSIHIPMSPTQLNTTARAHHLAFDTAEYITHGLYTISPISSDCSEYSTISSVSVSPISVRRGGRRRLVFDDVAEQQYNTLDNDADTEATQFNNSSTSASAGGGTTSSIQSIVSLNNPNSCTVNNNSPVCMTDEYYLPSITEQLMSPESYSSHHNPYSDTAALQFFK